MLAITQRMLASVGVLRSLIGLLLIVVPGCTVGDVSGPAGGGSSPDAGADNGGDAAPNGPDATPANFTLALAPPSIDTTLGTEVELSVVLSSINFAGSATLGAIGVPDSWSVAFDPPVVSLSLDGVATAIMRVTVPTNAAATTGQIQVEAAAAPGQRAAVASVAVANQVLVRLPTGTAGGAHPFPAPLEIRLGAQVTIANEDPELHRIHSDNSSEGFPHQEGEMGAGGEYSFTITQPGSYNYYCHIHDVGAGVGRIVVSSP